MDENHLDKFEGTCSVLVRESAYENFMEGRDSIGYGPSENDPNGSMFVSTSADMDRAISECNGDVSKLEASLGLPQGHFGDDPIVRVDINNPEEYGLRLANGREAGANEFYNTPLDENGQLPNIQYADANHRVIDTDKTDPAELGKLNGQYWDQNGQYHAPNSEGYTGKTSGGLDEAVINQVPNTPENVSYTRIDGFNRGQSGELSYNTMNDGYASSSYENQISGQLPKESPPQENNAEIAGQLPAASASAPNNTESPIAGTTPDKKQELDLSSCADSAANTGKDLGEDAGKKASNGIDAATGIV